MNCSQFEDRFHQLIDQRRSIDQDQELQMHADSCEHCCENLALWQSIDSLYAKPESGPATVVVSNQKPAANGVFQSVVWAMGIAAAIMFVVAFARPVDKEITVDTQPVPETQLAQVDPAQWWQSMQSKDWVAQTMPAVRTVRAGVAPIGRSLRSAVVILTASGDQA